MERSAPLVLPTVSGSPAGPPSRRLTRRLRLPSIYTTTVDNAPASSPTSVSRSAAFSSTSASVQTATDLISDAAVAAAAVEAAHAPRRNPVPRVLRRTRRPRRPVVFQSAAGSCSPARNRLHALPKSQPLSRPVVMLSPPCCGAQRPAGLLSPLTAGPETDFMSTPTLGARSLKPAEQEEVARSVEQTALFKSRDREKPLTISSWGTIYPSDPARAMHCPGGSTTPRRKGGPSEGDKWVEHELERFEQHMSVTVCERNYRTWLPKVSPAPPVANLLFQLMLLKGMRMVEKLGSIPRQELMGAFLVRATENGQVSRSSFHTVLRELCRHDFNSVSSDRLFELFDRDHSGDIDVREFEAGLSVVLDDVTPGDSLQYFFGLMNTRRRFPRYITKFELQTLVSVFCHQRRRSESAAEVASCVSAEAVFTEALSSLDFDYCGRASLQDFIAALRRNPQAFRALAGESEPPEPSRKPSIRKASIAQQPDRGA